jgi:hypothetical protein
MMLFSLLTLSIAFIGATNAILTTSTTKAVHATIDSVSIARSIPVVDLANIDVTRQNVTLATKGSSTLRVDAAQAPFPATLLLCRTTGCGSCTGFDISLFPHNTCLIANPAFGFFSVFITQPSNEGFAFGVYAGPTCPGLGLIPLVNTCFNVNGGPYQVFGASP